MNNFRIIYRILKYLEAALDVAAPDMTPIRAEALGLTEERWKALLLMMAREGYIWGLEYREYIGEASVIKIDRVQITMKGLEYLEENSMMRKVAEAAKGIVDILT